MRAATDTCGTAPPVQQLNLALRGHADEPFGFIFLRPGEHISELQGVVPTASKDPRAKQMMTLADVRIYIDKHRLLPPALLSAAAARGQSGNNAAEDMPLDYAFLSRNVRVARAQEATLPARAFWPVLSLTEDSIERHTAPLETGREVLASPSLAALHHRRASAAFKRTISSGAVTSPRDAASAAAHLHHAQPTEGGGDKSETVDIDDILFKHSRSEETSTVESPAPDVVHALSAAAATVAAGGEDGDDTTLRVSANAIIAAHSLLLKDLAGDGVVDDFFDDDETLQERIRQEPVRIVIVGNGIRDHGAIPNSTGTAAAAAASTIARFNSAGELPERFNHAYAIADKKEAIWIAVEGASDKDDRHGALAEVGRRFRLHPLTVEDCAASDVREKLEIFSDHIFISFHALVRENFPIIAPLRIILFRNIILTFHSRHINAVQLARKRLFSASAAGGEYAAPESGIVFLSPMPNAGLVLHALLDCITDDMIHVVNGTCREVDTLEDLVYVLTGFEHRDLLKRMSATRRRLAKLHQGLLAKRDILRSLIGKDWHRFVSSVPLVYLRDVYDHTITMSQQIDAATSMLQALQGTYHSKVSIEVAAAAHNTSVIMNRISMGGAVLLPLTVLTGLLGMNVTVPGQFAAPEALELDDMWPFIGICIFVVAFVVTMFVCFRVRGLL